MSIVRVLRKDGSEWVTVILTTHDYDSVKRRGRPKITRKLLFEKDVKYVFK